MAMQRNVYRVLKYGTVFGGIGGTLAGLYINDWDPTSLGIVRFGRAANAACSVVVDYKRTLQNLCTENEEYETLKSQVHLRSAVKLRDMCALNGGCFIKVGQHIGALEYLLPTEYVETMKVFHSDAPKSSIKDIRHVVKNELGKEVEDLFLSFDEEPIGTASLAQVHKAMLKDGTTVAVKVQHPRVRAHSLVDMASMELLVRIVAKIFPDFQFLWLAEETKKNLPLELDFVHEAKNCEKASSMYKHYSYLKVPKVFWEFTSTRVLTMEYCKGGKINDSDYMRENSISVNEVSKKLGDLYSEMIFSRGYIHCDPHPGNILVNKSSNGVELILLDHGLYQTLSDEFRITYCKLWGSVLNVKLDKVKKYSEKLGIGKMYPLFACMVTGRSWNAITQGVDKQQINTSEEDEIRNGAANYLPEISHILNHVPREMLLIFKTNDLLRGIETTLQTRANASSLLTMSKFCVRAVFKHKRRKCSGWICSLRLSSQEAVFIFKLNMYAFYLWLRELSILENIFRDRKWSMSSVIRQLDVLGKVATS